MALTPGSTSADPLQPSPHASMAPLEPSPSPQMLYMTPNHRVTKARYVTSSDPRGYVCVRFPFQFACSFPASPVYEYPLNGQWIMMDTDDGYVLWTGMCVVYATGAADSLQASGRVGLIVHALCLLTRCTGSTWQL